MGPEGYYENGFRDMPKADTESVGASVFQVAVNILANQLRGGNAGTMAEFLQLCTRAVETSGYGITYAVGPAGEFGLLVVPLASDGKSADLVTINGDYAMWCEIGTAENLRETLQVAEAKKHPMPALMDDPEIPGQRDTNTVH